jgi:hypothetical protein
LLFTVTPKPRTLEYPAQNETAIVKKKYIELVSRVSTEFIMAYVLYSKTCLN